MLKRLNEQVSSLAFCLTEEGLGLGLQLINCRLVKGMLALTYILSFSSESKQRGSKAAD
jgi:hypothetical protein